MRVRVKYHLVLKFEYTTLPLMGFWFCIGAIQGPGFVPQAPVPQAPVPLFWGLLKIQ